MGICLPKLFVVAATLINWDFRYILNGPSQAWVGDYFYLNWAVRRMLKVVFCVADFFQSCVFYSHISITDDDFRIFRQTTVSYFLIDLVWVALVPNCVKSPDVIIKVSCFGVVLEFDVSAINELHLTKLTKLLSDISA